MKGPIHESIRTNPGGLKKDENGFYPGSWEEIMEQQSKALTAQILDTEFEELLNWCKEIDETLNFAGEANIDYKEAENILKQFREYSTYTGTSMETLKEFYFKMKNEGRKIVSISTASSSITTVELAILEKFEESIEIIFEPVQYKKAPQVRPNFEIKHKGGKFRTRKEWD